MTKCEGDEGEGKMIDIVVKLITKSYASEGRREIIYRLVETASKA
jgi:hypothetical protein